MTRNFSTFSGPSLEICRGAWPSCPSTARTQAWLLKARRLVQPLHPEQWGGSGPGRPAQNTLPPPPAPSAISDRPRTEDRRPLPCVPWGLKRGCHRWQAAHQHSSSSTQHTGTALGLVCVEKNLGPQTQRPTLSQSGLGSSERRDLLLRGCEAAGGQQHLAVGLSPEPSSSSSLLHPLHYPQAWVPLGPWASSLWGFSLPRGLLG